MRHVRGGHVSVGVRLDKLLDVYGWHISDRVWLSELLVVLGWPVHDGLRVGCVRPV